MVFSFSKRTNGGVSTNSEIYVILMCIMSYQVIVSFSDEREE